MARKRTALLGIIAAAAAAVATPQVANAASAASFAAQARDVGLTAQEAELLQQRVDQVVAETGGTQVAVNEVVSADGTTETTLTLPGERAVRDLTDADSSSAAAGQWACDYGALCFYTGTWGWGDRKQFVTCKMHQLGEWAYGGSWLNNQTPGTRARFFDAHYHMVFETPGARSSEPEFRETAYFDSTFIVSPCR